MWHCRPVLHESMPRLDPRPRDCSQARGLWTIPLKRHWLGHYLSSQALPLSAWHAFFMEPATTPTTSHFHLHCFSRSLTRIFFSSRPSVCHCAFNSSSCALSRAFFTCMSINTDSPWFYACASLEIHLALGDGPLHCQPHNR